MNHLLSDQRAHGLIELRSSRSEMAMRWFKTALLIGLSAYFVYNIASGSLANYINARFAWLSYVAAASFGILGVMSAISALRSHTGGHDHQHDHEHEDHDHAHEDHGHDHDHAGLSWTNLAILSIPLLLGVLIPSRPLGASAVNGSMSTSAAVSGSMTFSVNPLDRNVLDWLRYFAAADDVHDVDGQPADVVGFVYKEPSFGEPYFMVSRFTISCCVADASAIGVPVYFADSPDLEQGVWVRVQGTFLAGSFRDGTMPILQATSVEVVDQPAHPYLYQ
ncbi:MAG: TIGR03943 family protein [Anaerolineae bacterium]